MTAGAAFQRCCHDGNTPATFAAYLKALGWAVTHAHTQEAYRRSTGEDVAPALARYREWLEANIIGGADDTLVHDGEEAA